LRFPCGLAKLWVHFRAPVVIRDRQDFMFVFDGQAWLFLTHHMLGLLVTFPEGRVSCRQDHALGLGLGLRGGLCRLQSAWGKGCMGQRLHGA